MSAHLLAIDLGLKTGLAVFSQRGALVRYRSQNYGTVSRLKRAAWGELASVSGLALVVVEGDRGLARVWARAAGKRGVCARCIQAHLWRQEILAEKDARSGVAAKAAAGVLARAVVTRSGLPRPTALRHDAAEAICIGLWACGQLGWPQIVR
ncbi:MAG TPA: hypothetical protein ENK57_13935 [Polyangiaceae bacterium]|nr:hypothetical protein [Polyangiaceae bacterium]